MARIYSQPVPYNPYGGQLSSRPMEALRGSLPYKQTDWRGRQRMESLVSMRLPAQSDITQVRQVGKRYDNVPIYSAPMHQPWGKFGSIGMDREREKSKPLSSGGGGSQPAQQPVKQQSPEVGTPTEKTPEGYLRNRYGYLQKDYTKEGFERNRFGYWTPSQQMPKGVEPSSMMKFSERSKEQAPQPSLAGSLRPWWSRGETAPRFPFANY